MEENDKWINSLRDQMEGYSEPVPEGLWEQLEGELDTSLPALPWWRRWQAVAAVALLVMATSVSVWFLQSPVVESMQKQSAALEELLPVEVEAVIPVVSETPSQQVASLLPRKVPVEQPTEATKETAAKEETETPGAEPQIEETYPEEQQTLPADTPVKQQGKGYSTRTVRPSKEKKTRRWSVGLSTGNGGGVSSVHTDGYLPLPPATHGMYIIHPGMEYMARSNMLLANKLPYKEMAKSQVNYRLPVTIGASVRFELNPDWALETGLTYTQLSSETTSGDYWNKYQWEETLHYVGIPLKVHRRIWNARRFEFYASAGGAVEKCVSGKQTMLQHTTEGDTPAEIDLNVKSLQWSLSAAVGAQFKLTEKLGIYAEPGIGYYFDDGNPVNTVRKEHPLNFHMQVGVRFSLSK